MTAPAIPDDWVLVPEKPTGEMIAAGVHAGVNASPSPWCPKAYRAMLAARPAAPVPAEGGNPERAVGQYVYDRISALMDAKVGTPEGEELVYLAALVSDVEEYGAKGSDGQLPWPSAPTQPEAGGEDRVYDENAEMFYSAAHLKDLLDQRDAFLVDHGLWSMFVEGLDAHRSAQGTGDE